MEKGLTTAEVKQQTKMFGKNIVESHELSSARQLFLGQFPTLINGILLIAAIFSLFIHNYLDSMFIFAIILLNAVFGFLQEYRAQKSLEKLKDYAAPMARVLRENQEAQILAKDLVPEDIVILSEGYRVPADGEIIEATHLEIDESILTGESLAVIKNKGEKVSRGTLVTKGKGLLKVEKTGMQTQFGKIEQTLASIKSEKTPLQINLDRMSKMLSLCAIVIGAFIIPIGLLHHEALIPLALTAISIAIAAIPEGLPAVVTIAFAVGTYRMAQRGAIVRKMAAIETLGAMQIILVDKTGTITQNTMSVKKYWTKGKTHLPLLHQACILGNTASLIQKGENKKYEIIGDQTDGALLLWAKEQMGKDDLSKDGKIVDEYVFDEKTKTITTVWQRHDKKYVFVRGAPEEVLEKCLLPKKEKEAIETQFETLANEKLRVIAFAYKTAPLKEHLTRVQLEKDLSFLGIVALYDPPREEVTQAIEKARTAGIHIMMVTGDNELTALSLAKEIGLINKDEDVLNGEELSKMTDEELEKIITQTSIFARTKPEEKLRLVTVLKQLGYVVGVTGDGINDSLALKKADVGVAMGESGTDVAKEAADIVLVNDNFSTIIKAVEEGRTIYKNIVNAILYLISGNLAEISLIFFAAVFQLPFPLLPTQILWINLITDSIPALALATGNGDAGVLKRKPRDPNSPILTFDRILFICIVGFSLAGGLLLLFVFLLHSNTQAQARTVIFNLLIYFHLLIVMYVGRHSIKKGNIFLIVTILLILVLQLLITSVPFFREVFHLAV